MYALNSNSLALSVVSNFRRSLRVASPRNFARALVCILPAPQSPSPKLETTRSLEVLMTCEEEKECLKPKPEKQLLAKEEEKNLIVDQLLDKHASYWKLLRVTAFVRWLIDKTEQRKGPLQREEFQVAEKFWITQVQASQAAKSDVNLKKGEDGILRCVGRVPGYHLVFLPRDCKLASSIIQQVHEQMLHGGVSTTMCCIREKFWIPKLRALKKVIRNCNVCKRYWKKPASTSCATTAALPAFRAERSTPFIVTGVNFVGPVYYKVRTSTIAKAYIALFTRASTRAVHQKLCRDLSAAEFPKSVKGVH